MVNLVLVGLPAAGKSSVAEILARRWGRRHLDSDAWIEQTTGQSIGQIFAEAGEEAFRRLEEQAVAELLAQPGAVVSLGGGAVLSPASRRLLAGHDVVWLEVSLATATRRAGLNRLRPLLLGDIRRQLEALNVERQPLYAAVARYRLMTDRLSPDEVAEAVLRLTGRAGLVADDGAADAGALATVGRAGPEVGQHHV